MLQRLRWAFPLLRLCPPPLLLLQSCPARRFCSWWSALFLPFGHCVAGWPPPHDEQVCRLDGFEVHIDPAGALLLQPPAVLKYWQRSPGLLAIGFAAALPLGLALSNCLSLGGGFTAPAAAGPPIIREKLGSAEEDARSSQARVATVESEPER